MIKKGQFSIQNFTKHFFKAKCGLKETINQFQVFDQNYELTALKKMQMFFDFLPSMFLWSKKASFLSGTSIKHFFQATFALKETMKKFQIFDQTHGLTSLEKCKFCDFFKSAFLWSRKASFLSRTLPNTFLRPNEVNK